MEAFVYGPEALRLWLDKGRDDRFPVLDRLIGEGVPLTADPPLGPQDQRTLVYDTAAPMLITAGDNAKPNQVRGFARQDVC